MDGAIGDRGAVASSNSAINTAIQTSVAAAFTATGNAVGDVNFSGTRYAAGSADLSSAIRALDANMNRFEQDLDKMDKEMRSGFASAAALSALVPNAHVDHATSISLGTGFYRDQVGGAIGVFHNVNDNVLLNMGVAYGGENSLTGRAGVTFGW